MEEIERLMDEAEEKSIIICEDCGGTGMEMEINNWIFTNSEFRIPHSELHYKKRGCA